MHVTTAMITAYRRAEHDYYQKGRGLGADRFIPTPDPVIKAMLAVALETAKPKVEPSAAPPSALSRRHIVTAYKPRRNR
jgi:hypothetical protein